MSNNKDVGDHINDSELYNVIIISMVILVVVTSSSLVGYLLIKYLLIK